MRVNVLVSLAIVMCIVIMPRHSFAAISLDRTRVVFNGTEEIMSVTITNRNKDLPYLAQAWVSDTEGNKIEAPLIALPPLQRVEPGDKSKIRLQLVDANGLPKDRESLFYFDLKEIPPKGPANALQLVLHTKVKLFYRPDSISKHAAKPWESINLKLDGNNYVVENPSPYYATIVAVARDADEKPLKKYKPIMLAPESAQSLGVSEGDIGLNPVLIFIDDYGGSPEAHFACSGDLCKQSSADNG